MVTYKCCIQTYLLRGTPGDSYMYYEMGIHNTVNTIKKKIIKLFLPATELIIFARHDQSNNH